MIETPDQGSPIGWGILIKEDLNPDGTGGRSLTIREARITPLGYGELKAARLHEPISVPLQILDAVPVQTDIADFGEDDRVTINTTLQSPFSAEAIGLVAGGWIPAGFAALDHRTTVLIDRNILSVIEGRFQNGQVVPDREDFLDFFAQYPVRLNPLLCVMEGNAKRAPTREEMSAELAKISAKLASALPQSQIVAGSESVSATLGLVEDSWRSAKASQAFLLQIAPDLRAPIGRARLPSVWANVVESARRHGVRQNSLVLLAVLSAIAVPNGLSPAKSIFKFRSGYDASDAYGALADLRALEVLCAVLALFPDNPAQFCTGDRALALFWTGIRASGFEYTGASYRFDLSPVEHLLPGETMAWWLALLNDADPFDP